MVKLSATCRAGTYLLFKGDSILSKIIIGIHGLGNKPPKKTLEKWWKQSIREGLKAFGYNHFFMKFELIYWAYILHPEPLNQKIINEDHPLYLSDPYIKAKNYGKKTPDKIKKKVLDYLEIQLDKLFLNVDNTINFSSVTDYIIRHFFRDLEIYYSSTKIQTEESMQLARTVIRNQLADIIRKYGKRDILLIGHSMGSIIAYDVLTQLVPDVKIDTFVTIGSPLGLPIIMNKINLEQTKNLSSGLMPVTPENINKKWFNFSDLRDKVALNYNLGDDYKENAKGIKPIDEIVYNNYEYNDEKNPHKSYGYLRTPEMADVINEFLNRGRSKIMIWFDEKMNHLFSMHHKRKKATEYS